MNIALLRQRDTPHLSFRKFESSRAIRNPVLYSEFLVSLARPRLPGMTRKVESHLSHLLYSCQRATYSKEYVAMTYKCVRIFGEPNRRLKES